MKEKLKVINLIHVSLIIGLLLAYYVLGNINSLDAFKLPTIDSSSIIYALIPVFAFLASNFMFKSVISKIDSNLSLEEKFAPYQTASIIRWAILEGSAFLILILKPDFLLFGLLIILYFILIRPTESRIKSDLNHLSNR